MVKFRELFTQFVCRTLPRTLLVTTVVALKQQISPFDSLIPTAS